MKRKLLAAAITAGLASAAANAVNVNPDGIGQVLLYPYYSVRGGQDTLISIVNTSETTAKAVKIRFLEGKNSREVLDFNIYLSEADVWTGAIVATETGAKIITADESCTVPNVPADGVEFRTFEFTGLRADGESTSPNRTREGYIEVFEMGELFDESDPSTHKPASAARHVNGIPGDCDSLIAAWASGGVWTADPRRGVDLPDPAGELFGGGILINVDRATDVSYNSTALEGFFNPGSSLFSLHTAPGSLLPNLSQTNPSTSYVNLGTTVRETNWIDGIDAVSAVLVHDQIMNEYLSETGLNASTDWVVTFPTKSFYVQRTTANLADGQAERPFTSVFGGVDDEPVAGGACEGISPKFWDREERTTVGDVDFSPLPPSGRTELCWETNVITLNGSTVLGSELSNNIDTDTFESGWMRIGFFGTRQFMGPSSDGQSENLEMDNYFGLPVIGFAVMDFENGVAEGQLKNYANLFNHRATRSFLLGSN